MSLLADIVAAYDRCESNRGRFSCVPAHDIRCPKGLAETAQDWRGRDPWICVCGGDELDALIERARAFCGL